MAKPYTLGTIFSYLWCKVQWVKKLRRAATKAFSPVLGSSGTILAFPETWLYGKREARTCDSRQVSRAKRHLKVRLRSPDLARLVLLPPFPPWWTNFRP